MKLYEFPVIVAAETEHEAKAILEKAGIIGVDEIVYECEYDKDIKDIADYAHIWNKEKKEII